MARLSHIPRILLTPRLLLCMLPLLLLPCLRAQALPTATQGFRLQTYALASTVQPAFGAHQTNFGFTAGADVSTFRLSRRLDPSIDARVLGSSGAVSNQFFFGGGPRLTLDLGPIKPYAEFLLGEGIIHFPNTRDPNYTHDNSLVAAYGGGVDLPLHRNLALRAEVLGQRWQVGSQSAPFHPLAVSVGVRYQIRLRSHGDPGL